MKKFHYLDTIISPNITEKSTSLSAFNKIVFKVDKGANKESIKRSVEKIFKVNVIKDACRAIDLEGSLDKSLNDMKNKGVNLICSGDL